MPNRISLGAAGKALELAGSGWTLVAGSARLARRLHYLYAADRVQAQHGAWETPDILPWEAWCMRTLQDLEGPGSAAVPLTRIQAHWLWRQVIEGSGEGPHLLHSAGVAREAAHAAWLLEQWLVPALPPGLVLNEDAQAFQRWLRHFRARCDALGLLDPAMLEAELMARLSRAGAAGRRVAVIGFDTLTPRQQAVLAAVRNAGGEVAGIAAGPRGAGPVVAACRDRREEMRAAAAWARGLLETSPEISIGIVIPDLADHHRLAEDVFEDELVPGALLRRHDPDARGFNIGFAPALAGYPLVSAALGALTLAGGRARLAEACRVLRSPWLGAGDDEAAAISKVEDRLRRRGEPEIGLEEVQQAAERVDADALGPLLQRLRAVAALVKSFPARQGARGWAAGFSAVLSAFGWPGRRPLDSAEYQCAEAWREALSEFASLELCGASLDWRGALRELRAAVEQIAFLPRSPEQPVEILGMSGAAALGFDRLWVMGLSEDTWPPPPRPSPFIPLRLQRELGMPRATPEIALAEARDLTRTLAGAADAVIFSYPENEGETPLRPSPLISGFPAAPPAGRTPTDFTARVFAARRVEVVEDSMAPAVAGGTAPGGTAIFRDQSACPFLAFARHRLRAEAPRPVDIGLDAAERGQLAHHALQEFWQATGGQGRLMAMDAAALSDAVGRAVDKALRRLRERRTRSATKRFVEVERARLVALLSEWLALERLRPPFEVAALEEKVEAVVGGLAVRLRIDRVDVLPDGTAVILDYKTGEAAAADWFGERPADPQLPLYAVSATRPVGVLAFARLRPGKVAFEGVARNADVLPGVRTPDALPASGGAWDTMLGGWRRVLERLAGGFLAGDARVEPRDRQVCRRCDLHALCRIAESGPEVDDRD